MQNHTRRNSLRYRGYDYGSPGAVLVTICTGNRQHLFGTVRSGVMHLNPQGAMVQDRWQRTAERFPDVLLDAFVIMPDHLHGIVYLGADPAQEPTRFLLSNVIRSFKSATVRAWTNGVRESDWPRYDEALWQRGFYDVILNLERPLVWAQEYIESNPARWQAKRDGVMP